MKKINILSPVAYHRQTTYFSGWIMKVAPVDWLVNVVPLVGSTSDLMLVLLKYLVQCCLTGWGWQVRQLPKQLVNIVR